MNRSTHHYRSITNTECTITWISMQQEYEPGGPALMTPRLGCLAAGRLSNEWTNKPTRHQSTSDLFSLLCVRLDRWRTDSNLERFNEPTHMQVHLKSWAPVRHGPRAGPDWGRLSFWPLFRYHWHKEWISLCNRFRRIFPSKSWIDTLPDFVFTKPWSCPCHETLLSPW